MASFSDGTPLVADLGPSCRPLRYGKGATEWLLWPVWAWHVAVPAVRWHGLNLFQHHVLALAARGVTEIAELDRRLALGKELCAFVRDQLVSSGHLQPDGAPSVKGRAYLAEHDESEPELVPGYVFHDAHSGVLWPRFVPGTPREVQLGGEGGLGRRVSIERGTPGRVESRNCRVVWPEGDTREPRAPSPQRIRQACRLWKRHRDAHERAAGDAPQESFEDLDTLRRLGEGRISVLSRRPTPMFLTTFAFLPEGLDEGELWQVCDPFGLGTSASLRRQVEDLVEAGHDALAEVLESLLARELHVDAAEIAGGRSARHRDAGERVAALGEGMDLPQPLSRALTQMEEAHRTYAERRRGSWQERQRAARALLRRAWEAVEELFAWLTETWADPEVADRLGRSVDENASMLARLAIGFGFENDEVLDSLGRLLRVTRNQVKGAVSHENRDLPAMAAAAILTATTDAAHPLHAAARTFPRLFVVLDQLKRARDPVAHHGASSVDVDEASQTAHVWDACRSLLPGGGAARRTSATNAQDSAWAERAAQRLRARAVRRVEEAFGLGIRAHPALRRDLVELERVREELELHGDGGDEATEALRKDLPVAAGAAVEGLLAAMLTSTGLPGWVTAQSDAEIHVAAVELVRELGLRAGPDVEAILAASPERVRRAVRNGRGPLTTLAKLVLLSSRDDAAHPLREIARAHPDVLARVGRIAARRGHGDRAAARADALGLADEVRDLCALILSHLA